MSLRQRNSWERVIWAAIMIITLGVMLSPSGCNEYTTINYYGSDSSVQAPDGDPDGGIEDSGYEGDIDTDTDTDVDVADAGTDAGFTKEDSSVSHYYACLNVCIKNGVPSGHYVDCPSVAFQCEHDCWHDLVDDLKTYLDQDDVTGVLVDVRYGWCSEKHERYPV